MAAGLAAVVLSTSVVPANAMQVNVRADQDESESVSESTYLLQEEADECGSATQLTDGTEVASIEGISVESPDGTISTQIMADAGTGRFFYTVAKNAKISKNKTVTRTIKGLKKGKKYYVRVRCYKKLNGKTVYSKWSTKKTVKVKKK